MLEHISTALCYGWLVIGILFLVVELHMPGFLGFVSCALGCGAAAAGAYFQIALFWQCWIAVGAAGLSFAGLWLIFAKPARHEAYRSNVQGLIGKQATVILPIASNRPGRVKIKGEEWVAITKGSSILEKSHKVRVVAVDGNMLVVE